MPSSVITGFVAYPSVPEQIGDSIRTGCKRLLTLKANHVLTPWESSDIAGYCLTDPILESIKVSDLLVADVTRLNFNVTYEIGYAIGRQKRVFLICNKSLIRDEALKREVGIFDTLGVEFYSNSEDFAKLLANIGSLAPIPLPNSGLNKRVPVYIVTPREKAEAEIRILSRIQTTGGIYFRSFDPIENARLSARSAIENVCQSIGIVLPLLPANRSDAVAHNLRCAFVAGLAHALEKETLLVQAGSTEPVPIDLRDQVSIFGSLDSIDRIIAQFAPRITKRLQEDDDFVLSESSSPLSDLFLGQSAAENEIAHLSSYYLQTEEFSRIVNGDVSVVAGRKGSGKTALFFQTRDRLERDRQNIVLALNPEGFQLQKFKSVVLQHLEKGTREHTVTAFWEYLFLLEVAHKLLERDRTTHVHNEVLRDRYARVQAIYGNDQFEAEGDFAERMLKLTESIEDAFQGRASSGEGPLFLTRDQITQLLYLHDIRKLRDVTTEYLSLKKGLWILFDNIDKGWHAHGIDEEDLLILRCLIDAFSKFRRELGKREIPCKTVTFIRNDVYELLVGSLPDRGKMSKIALDWTDSGLLKELLRRRFILSVKDKEADFETIWRNLAETHIFGGQESSAYVLNRCLMRPRALIDFLNHAKGHAVNLRHTKILEEDFKVGERAYSTDLINQIDLEIQDVNPQASESLYAFIEAPNLLDQAQLEKYLARLGPGATSHEEIIVLLLWYAFLGIFREDGTTTYIHDVNYEMRKLIALRDARPSTELVYRINPAFWAGLDIKTDL